MLSSDVSIHKFGACRFRGSRLSLKSAKLTDKEFEYFRSLVYKLAWVGQESRPEASGTASILAQRLPYATIHDVGIANQMVRLQRGIHPLQLPICPLAGEQQMILD